MARSFSPSRSHNIDFPDLQRVLVVRGGAIGDFILTLPALKALRQAQPRAYIEILGYKHIVALAENRFYAQAVRSIEYGPLSSFFARDSDLPQELTNYFASFDLIISYLYDPDGIFESNLRRCGAQKILHGPGKIDNSGHATWQLANPIEELGIEVVDFAAKIFPSADDRQFAHQFLHGLPRPILALHPGSGSEKKNWPIQNWIEIMECGDMSPLSKARTCPRTPKPAIVVISGEADAQIAQLEALWKSPCVRFAKNLPLPCLGAMLEQSIFVGHDSGISHLAAAAGAVCVLLFGPSDPAIWAPLNENVRVLRAPGDDLRRLDVDFVRDAFDQALMRIGIKT